LFSAEGKLFMERITGVVGVPSEITSTKGALIALAVTGAIRIAARSVIAIAILTVMRAD
jgi:hypothetical protein